MDLEKTNNNSMIIKYQNTDNVVEDICSIIESARNYAYQSVNIALVERNWFIGYRIAEEELKGNDRADERDLDLSDAAENDSSCKSKSH